MAFAQLGVGAEPNGKHHHVGLYGALVCHHALHAALALNALHRLAKGQLHTALAQGVRHAGAEIVVIIARKAGGRTVNQRGVAAVAHKGLGQLYPNVARAHHGHAADFAVGQLFHHSLCMAVFFHKLHVLQLHARHGRADGHRARG